MTAYIGKAAGQLQVAVGPLREAFGQQKGHVLNLGRAFRIAAKAGVSEERETGKPHTAPGGRSLFVDMAAGGTPAAQLVVAVLAEPLPHLAPE